MESTMQQKIKTINQLYIQNPLKLMSLALPSLDPLIIITITPVSITQSFIEQSKQKINTNKFKRKKKN
jgi:pentose-5-phosphate-3-epimerase